MLYENQLIGYFIYQLGFYSGVNKTILENQIHLLQQTPLDKCLGDLLADYNGKLFLIEFKRSKETLHTEVEKQKFIKLKRYSENDIVLTRSKRCHFIAYGDREENLLFNYYLLIDSPNIIHDFININQFIENAECSSDFGISNYKEFEQYVDLLSGIDTSSEEIGGLMISYKKSSSPLVKLYSNYKELKKSLSISKEKTKRIGFEM